MIYICVPAHNEARTLGVLLWKIRRVFKEFDRDYRILVLDDASTDDTAEVLERYRQVLPLDVVTSPERLGYGGALDKILRVAVEKAPYPKRDVIVTLQGDFTEGPDDIVPLIKAIEGGADLVAGSVGSVGTPPRAVKLSRWAADRLLRSSLASAPVSDPTCGLRAYRVVVVKKALRDRGDAPLVQGNGLVANVELLRTLAPHARRIQDTPIALRYDLRKRGSRMKPLSTTLDLFKIRNRPWLPSENTT